MRRNQKNRTEPEDVFNFLGEQQFGSEWSHLPLQILQKNADKSKVSKETYRRNKYMADRIFKKFSKLLKEPDVSIYATLQPYDTDVENIETARWDKPDFRISKDFFLIERERDKDGDPIDMARRNFWVEMPDKKNILVHKKSGRKPKHDINYLRSILNEVVSLVPGKISYQSVSDAYAKFFKGTDKHHPSQSWVNLNLHKEVMKLKENQ